MLIDRLFERDDGKQFSLSDIEKGKARPVRKQFEKIDGSAQRYFESYAINYKEIEKFYSGDHWHQTRITKPSLTVNGAGEPVYDNIAMFEKHLEEKKPQRTVNLIKSRIKSLVAYHAETSPLPVATPRNDYVYDEELIKKINLLLKQVFVTDNSLQHMYEVGTEEVYLYGQSAIRVYFDKEYSDNPILPIKFEFINYNDIRFDSSAQNIQQSDYVIHTLHMKYYQMLEKYVYTPEAKDNVPDLNMDVDIKHYWIRTKKNNVVKWICFAFFNDEMLPFKIGEEKKQFLDLCRAPFVIMRHTITKNIHGESFVPDLIPPQIEYNMTLSEYDWNWRRYIDPAIITDDDPEHIKDGQRPNGIISLNTGKTATPWKYDLVSAGDFEQRKMSIEADMDKIMGSISAIQGQKGAGIYSNNLFQSIKEGQELVPKMREGVLLDCIDELATTTLDLIAEYLGSRKVELFDPDSEKNIKVGEADIKDSRYKIDVKIYDAKLMSKEQRFAMLEKLLQYAKFGEKMPTYYIARMFEGHARGLIPADVLKALKDDMLKGNQQVLNPPIQQGVQPGGEQPPATPAGQEIDNQTFTQQIDKLVSRMEQAGIGRDFINTEIFMTLVNSTYEDVIKNPDIIEQNGINKLDFIASLQQVVDKSLNAVNTAQ